MQPVTEEELAEMERREKLEQKQSYCENEVKKNRRIAKHSLDADNKRIYNHRAEVFEEKAEEAGEALAKSGESGIIKPKNVKSVVHNKDLSKYINKSITETNNKSIREWYVANVNNIPNMIDKSLSKEEQARQAFELRNKFKREARIAMSDVETAEWLERKRPIPTFEELIESKMQRKGMTREEAIEDILKTASTTNADVNKEFGLLGDENV